MKKVLFLVNLVSGKKMGRNIKERIPPELHGILNPNQYDMEFTETGTAMQIKDISPGYETLVVVGGDGTLHQVVEGIVGLKNKPKIGIIPTGTGNDIAKSLGILPIFESYGLRALLEVILKGKTVSVDIIGLNNKYFFANYFGIGNDAKISNDFGRLRLTPLFRRGRFLFFNQALYVLIGLKGGFYRIPFGVELKYKKNHSTTETLALTKGIREILLTNVKTYAGGDYLSSKCKMDDGKFEVTIIFSLWQWLMMHCTRFLKKPLDVICSGLTQFQTDMLEITFTGDTFYQIDGETFDDFSKGRKCLSVSVESAIEMIVP